jgi:hypothetical protein
LAGLRAPFVFLAAWLTVGCANRAHSDLSAEGTVHYCGSDPPPVVELRVRGPAKELIFRGDKALGWYPPRALDLGRSGRATLQCALANGSASHCTILHEDASGMSFGALALRAATRLPLPEGSDGAQVRLDYRWSLLKPGVTACVMRDIGAGIRLPVQ